MPGANAGIGCFGIDIEPAHFAPRNRLIEALQQIVIDSTGQARRPILFFELSDLPGCRRNQQHADRDRTGEPPDSHWQRYPCEMNLVLR